MAVGEMSRSWDEVLSKNVRICICSFDKSAKLLKVRIFTVQIERSDCDSTCITFSLREEKSFFRVRDWQSA
jgi:hypothetical protein